LRGFSRAGSVAGVLPASSAAAFFAKVGFGAAKVEASDAMTKAGPLDEVDAVADQSTDELQRE